MRTKVKGVNEFAKELDAIFDMGTPTKAQIINAYNKYASEVTADLLKRNELLEQLVKVQDELTQYTGFISMPKSFWNDKIKLQDKIADLTNQLKEK